MRVTDQLAVCAGDSPSLTVPEITTVPGAQVRWNFSDPQKAAGKQNYPITELSNECPRPPYHCR